MGRYKGLGMPRAKKKKLEEARERLTKQVHWADAENNDPLAVCEPAAHVPAAREPTAADKVKQELQLVRPARSAGGVVVDRCGAFKRCAE